MFVDEEPDKNTWVTRINPDGSDYMENPHEYEKAHLQWRKRQYRPELCIHPFSTCSRNECLDRDCVYYDSGWIGDSERQKAFDYYNAHRLRWKGFELKHKETTNTFGTIYLEIEDPNWCEIIFYKDGLIVVSTETTKYSTRSISVSLFEQICQENGINLESIEETKQN